MQQHIPERPPNTSSHASSRSGTPAVAPRAARAPRKPTRRVANRSEASSNASTPRPTPPPIPLPNALEPPPSNFLRNQQALLGLAGLVGGVNPANLALPRGSSANNPIVVDDSEDTPTIGRRPPQSYYSMAGPVVYPAVVPAPSSDDIIQTLIKQKNVFPVVGALLSLVARTSEGQSIWSQYHAQPSGFHRPYVNGPDFVQTSKRRKVNDVPAGAADWDVPYPFHTGEGPANYRANWERHRSKQLIEDLIGLVKSAARKAAAKNYYKMQQQQALPAVMETEPGKVFRHYRPETLRYGLEPGQAPPAPTQNVPVPPTPSSGSTSAPAPTFAFGPSTPPAPSIDELLSAMMAGTVPESSSTSLHINNVFPASSSPPSAYSSTSALYSSSATASSSSLSASASISPPSNDLAPELQPNIDDFLAMIDSLPQGELSGLFTSEDMFDPSTLGPIPSPSNGDSATSLPPRFTEAPPPAIDFSDPFLASIDPVLLGFSVPPSGSSSIDVHTETVKGRSVSTGPPPTPNLVGSPLSLDHDEYDPPTPNWECAFPEPDVAGGEGGVSEDMRMSAVGEIGASDGASRYEGACLKGGNLRKRVLMKGLVRSAEGLLVKRDKGKGREIGLPVSATSGHQFPLDADVVMQDFGPAHDGYGIPGSQFTFFATVPQQSQLENLNTTYHTPIQTSPPAQYAPIASTSTAPPPSSEPPLPFPLSLAIPILQVTQSSSTRSSSSASPSSQASQYKTHKQETLKRARAMRAQIVSEIQRAKVELWETAMEGGCLVVLGKEVAKEQKGKEKA
ncbi:hypothetical protein EUX98_g966 [Antrodiella citrinella]|uniref:Uncharacterized protein n=1 Tax=Antrodiella citrinella TaxID=2447956 RepID=A0A4S4N2K5_9APHY|nr:hypothetical protein EUX98_g966 [Antrodiella citrinella]